MAKSRSIPTSLMQDPDYMELASDAQAILLMLILTADDEGRGQAHTGMLSRHFNKSPETIENTLTTLASLDLITCYVVGRHRYYQLLRWWEWQTLSKPTPSRFPHPPASFQPDARTPGLPGETQETPGNTLPEGEGEGKGNRREQNLEAKEKDTDLPPGVMRFPHPPTTPIADAYTAGSSVVSLAPLSGQGPENEPFALPTQQVANILHLPVTEPLTSLMTEYATFGSLALLGEADAAHEWIEDRTRNRKNARMTVPFFRRWLKRERERIDQRAMTAPSAPIQPLDALADTRVRTSGQRWRGEIYPQQERRLPSLMHLVEEDKQARGGRD